MFNMTIEDVFTVAIRVDAIEAFRKRLSEATVGDDIGVVFSSAAGPPR